MDCFSNLLSLLLVLSLLVFNCGGALPTSDDDDGAVKYKCPAKTRLSHCEKDECQNNDDCEKGMWCCAGSCSKNETGGKNSKLCVKPTKIACPAKTKVFNKCQNTCETDANCTAGYLCCEGGCSEDKEHRKFYKTCVEPNVCFDYCEHGSSCIIEHSNNDKPFCFCMPGFYGDRCELDIDDCASNPCVHGTCVDKVNDYQCCCNEGYAGKNCSEKNMCEKTPKIVPQRDMFVENLCLRQDNMACQNFMDATKSIICKMVPHYFYVKEDGNEIDITDYCLRPEDRGPIFAP